MNKTLILVVEDDTPVHNLITTTLKTHDYKYISAKNGAGAIMEASTHNPDIVLLDLGLPDIDGVEVIEKIRSWSNMPIIVISARSEDSDKIEALDAGADDYLTKPFSVEELLARLRVTQRRLSQMQAENGVQSAVFENGALRITVIIINIFCYISFIFCIVISTFFQKSIIKVIGIVYISISIVIANFLQSSISCCIIVIIYFFITIIFISNS